MFKPLKCHVLLCTQRLKGQTQRQTEREDAKAVEQRATLHMGCQNEVSGHVAPGVGIPIEKPTSSSIYCAF